MELFRISHLPIVDGKEYLGLISDKEMDDESLNDKHLLDISQSLATPYIYGHQHIFEAAQILLDLNLSAIPVLNVNDEYMGIITYDDISRKIVELATVNDQPGAIIVLEMNPIDYTLSQIAQIIESNDAKILSLFISKATPNNQILVTVKTNVSDASAIIQTFMRYNYSIYAAFMDNSLLKDIYKDRYEQFLKYISV